MFKVFLILVSFLVFSCTPKNGDRIPSFEYVSLNGETVNSKSIEGKATVICVWATWCGDCIREIPELNQLVEKYKGKDEVAFLAFSDEDKPTVEKSLNRFPFKFTHLVNSKEYSDKLKMGVTKHFPQVMLINKDLEIVFNVTENKEPIFGVLDKHIQEIIK